MVSLSSFVRVVREELRVDFHRVGANAVSRMFPQHSFVRVRTVLLRAFGVRVGAKSCFAGSLKITGSGSLARLLSFGPGCYLTGPLHIDLAAPVRIGSHVYMGYEVMLMTVDHALGPSGQRCGSRVYGDIEIGDGAWLGSRTVILPGVRIGAGAVVAAGAVVTKDVDPDTLVAGVPAKFVRDLDEESVSIPPSDRRCRLATGDERGRRAS